MHDNRATLGGRSPSFLAPLRFVLCLVGASCIGSVCANAEAGTPVDVTAGAVRTDSLIDPDAAELSARLDRLLAGGAIDEATSMAVRALLAQVEGRRIRLDAHVVAAAGAATAIAELEREAAARRDGRLARRPGPAAAQTPPACHPGSAR